MGRRRGRGRLPEEYPAKTEWGDGPWQDEPDRFEWQTRAGYPGAIFRHPRHGQLNGYVGVLADHPDYKKDYDEIEADVHGGLTYSGETPGGFINSLEQELPIWWFGFDCAHFQDCMPGLEAMERRLPNWDLPDPHERHFTPEARAAGMLHIYWELPMVRDEVESLAFQLREREAAAKGVAFWPERGKL